MQEFLTSALESWAALYSNHAALRTAIEFLHVGGLVISGGLAITTDRAILLARRGDSAERSLQIRNIHQSHVVVAIGLIVVIGSGLFLLAADTGTYLHSLVFWAKMACFVLLLINGLLLRQAGRSAGEDPQAWRRLSATAAVSITLWLLTTLLGSALPNIS
jgi:uncharacterized membrane-anchored protein